MKTFSVLWEIEIDAETKEEAAKKALEIQRDPDSIATVFIVEGEEVDAEIAILKDKDICLLYSSLSKDEIIDVLYSAIDYMQSCNSRSRTDCIAMAMGYDIYPTGGYIKVSE